MSIHETILLGVISGIITSMVLFLLARFFHDSIVPWIRSVRYKGIDISGTWHCLPKEMNQEFQLEITQKAQKLSGVATFITKQSESSLNPKYKTGYQFENIRSFSISGEISDRFILLNLKNVDRKRLGITAFVLEVCGDGRKLQGAFSYYRPALDSISCSDVVVCRDREQAKYINESPVDHNRIKKTPQKNK